MILGLTISFTSLLALLSWRLETSFVCLCSRGSPRALAVDSMTGVGPIRIVAAALLGRLCEVIVLLKVEVFSGLRVS